MLSCGSSNPPKQLIVHVEPEYSGTIHIEACVKSSPASDISVDARGFGSTSLCPSADDRIELTIIRGSQTVVVNSSEINISRTGDGIATSIETKIKP
jgi:hypothetical protein